MLCGVIHEVLGKHRYKVLTNVGILKGQIQRSQLLYHVEDTMQSLGIEGKLAKLPYISEKDAIALLDPLHAGTSFCVCKNVSVHRCV